MYHGYQNFWNVCMLPYSGTSVNIIAVKRTKIPREYSTKHTEYKIEGRLFQTNIRIFFFIFPKLVQQTLWHDNVTYITRLIIVTAMISS